MNFEMFVSTSNFNGIWVGCACLSKSHPYLSYTLLHYTVLSNRMMQKPLKMWPSGCKIAALNQE
jgi:hypothetical protein